MIAFVRGKLIHATPLEVIVDAHGIGYRVLIPASLFSQLPQINDEILLHTSFVVREQSHTLFGFQIPQEKELFELLISVNGIGPKTALSIIGHLSSHNLYESIKNNNIAHICKVPGVGKKTAERLIIEIRDKLPAMPGASPLDYAITIQGCPQEQIIRDAMSTLINLGYNQVLAQKAIKKTLKEQPEMTDLAELITLSLKNTF